MSRKDYRHREPKKPKKDSKKTASISFEPEITVEVMKKGKKKSSPPEE